MGGRRWVVVMVVVLRVDRCARRLLSVVRLVRLVVLVRRARLLGQTRNWLFCLPSSLSKGSSMLKPVFINVWHANTSRFCVVIGWCKTRGVSSFFLTQRESIKVLK